MARLKTEQITYQSDTNRDDFIKCKTDIYVDSEGFFTTTLPAETVKILKEANVDLSANRMRTLGFFSNKTLDGLIANVKEIFKLALSRTLFSSTIIIQYSIQTDCSYMIHPETGDFVPNGQHVKGGDGSLRRSGTHESGMGVSKYGLQVYAMPYKKNIYIYANGTEKVEMKPLTFLDGVYSEYKDRPNLVWLSGVIRNSPSGKVQEIEYNEAIAKFFVDLHISIMKINEAIKEKLDPTTIKVIAEGGLRFLA